MYTVQELLLLVHYKYGANYNLEPKPNNFQAANLIAIKGAVIFMVTTSNCITVFILIEHKQKNDNNFKSGLRTIRLKTFPGSGFSSVN